MKLTRRQALIGFSSSAVLLGLRSLVSGIPPSILLNPKDAKAAMRIDEQQAAPQFVIYSTSGSGDPVNANAPGTYDNPLAVHAQHPSMAATAINQAGTSRKGAAVWAGLPQPMLDRLAFFHHGTYTIIHTEVSKVMRLQGAVNQNDMLPCMLARNLAPALGTIASQPLCLYADLNQALVDNGIPLPMHPPASFANVIGIPRGALGSKTIMTLRDRSLDALNAYAKREGKAFQREFLDRYALTQNEARAVQDKLGATLTQIKDNKVDSQIALAVAVFQLKLSPVAAITLPFGGDNHADGLDASQLTQYEVPAHESGVASLGKMYAAIGAAGLTENVSFLHTNVFGRNLTERAGAKNGRGHNDTHAVSLLYGPKIRGGVIGGVAENPATNDLRATPIDAATGASAAAGDVSYAATLASMGKTFSAAAGLNGPALETAFRAGTRVNGALAS